MNLRSLHKDEIYIEKTDGTRLGPYKAAVADGCATTYDAKLDANEGEKLIRLLPTGKEESYLITSSDFKPGLASIPASFKLKLQKATAIQSTSPMTTNTTVHINNSTGFQVGDNNVINIQNAINELIQQIENADAQPHEKAEAKNRIEAFLTHPLVVSILGGVAGSIPSVLGS
jgi:hypothetical protein